MYDQAGLTLISTPLVQKAPSQLVDELLNPPKVIQGWRPKPTVVELLNIAEYSHQVCIVQLVTYVTPQQHKGLNCYRPFAGQ